MMVLASWLLLAAAHADPGCAALVERAASVSGDDAAELFVELVDCDAKLAEKHFGDFMRAAGEVGALVELSLTAIDAQLYTPVWKMLDKVPDIGARVEVAKGVGAQCDAHAEVLPFLKGALLALDDRQFGAWRDALTTCAADDMVAWLAEVAARPPSVPYDEKYNAVTDALVKHRRADALPVLEQAAIHAGTEGGPFLTALDRMADAVRPEGFGAKLTAADTELLEAALVRVAEAVPPEQARQVGERLYQAGSGGTAATLLPRIFPDRVTDGRLRYGVAAVESCGGDAVVHHALVSEPATRWTIVDDVTPLARAFKPRLKCRAEEAWPVVTTPEPVGGDEDVARWAADLVSQWEGRGVATKAREEKPIALP